MVSQTFVPTDVGFSWDRAAVVLAEAWASTGPSHTADARTRVRREADEAAVRLLATAQGAATAPR